MYLFNRRFVAYILFVDEPDIIQAGLGLITENVVARFISFKISTSVSFCTLLIHFTPIV